MDLLNASNKTPMKLQRCQHGEVSSLYDFRIDTGGACGPGLYAMLFGDRPMQKYYTAQGENTFSFEVPDNLVKKIGGKGVTTYWAIREAIFREQEKGFKVFICKHSGINIPTSKQIVITDPSIITNICKL
jgi:hypothetical protein